MGGGGRKSLAYLKNNKKLKPIFILVRCVQFLSIAKQFLSIANNVDEPDQLGIMLNTCKYRPVDFFYTVCYDWI